MVVINSKILVTWFLAALLLATHVCDPVECPISCQCLSLPIVSQGFCTTFDSVTS